MPGSKRSRFIGLFVLIPGLVCTSAAQTPPLTCVANAAVPPNLRSEGLTERLADIAVVCTGGTPTASGNIPRLDLRVYLNSGYTNRTYSVSNDSDALLVIDEPGSFNNPSAVFGVCADALTGCDVAAGTLAGAATPYTGQTGRPNVFRGIVTGNLVEFKGVPLDPPGVTTQRVLRIVNLRANAASVLPGAGGVPGTIQALLSFAGPAVPFLHNPTQIVGFVLNGLSFAPRLRNDRAVLPNTSTDITFAQGTSLSRTSAAGQFILDFAESFPGAFKAAGTAAQQAVGAIYDTESGLTVPFTSAVPAVAGTAGLAESGTRLKATFTNIPSGVSVYASVGNYYSDAVSPGARAVLVSAEGAGATVVPAGFTDFQLAAGGVSGFSSGSPAGPTAGAQLPVVNGKAVAVWEVKGADPVLTERFYFSIWFAYTSNRAQNLPAPGSATVTGSFAPAPSGLGAGFETAASASQTLWIPRFVEGTQLRLIFKISAGGRTPTPLPPGTGPVSDR